MIRALKRWLGAVHLRSYARNNSPIGIRHAARRPKGRRAIDLDLVADIQGGDWAKHWLEMGRDGYRHRRIPRSRGARIDTLPTTVVAGYRRPLRLGPPRRLHRYTDLIALAGRLGVERIECELKDAGPLQRRRTAVPCLRRIAQAADDAGVELQFKTLSNIGDPVARLRWCAEAAPNVPRILLRRGPDPAGIDLLATHFRD